MCSMPTPCNRRHQPWSGALTALLLGASLVVPLQTPGARAQGWAPALPPNRPLPAPGPMALPSQPSALGTPRLASQVSCPTLQQRLLTVIGSESAVWSVSVADPSGRLLADVNGQIGRAHV